jgi:hypothetical protein
MRVFTGESHTIRCILRAARGAGSIQRELEEDPPNGLATCGGKACLSTPRGSGRTTSIPAARSERLLFRMFAHSESRNTIPTKLRSRCASHQRLARCTAVWRGRRRWLVRGCCSPRPVARMTDRGPRRGASSGSIPVAHTSPRAGTSPDEPLPSLMPPTLEFPLVRTPTDPSFIRSLQHLCAGAVPQGEKWSQSIRVRSSAPVVPAQRACPGDLGCMRLRVSQVELRRVRLYADKWIWDEG